MFKEVLTVLETMGWKKKDAPNKDISDFLLAEYDNIAKAHFNAQEILSRWVRFYFLVIAVPITLLALMSGKVEINKIIATPPTSFSGLVLLVGLVGTCISLLIIDVRLDASLYARSVNGIRKYFVEREKMATANTANERQVRLDPSLYVVLPTNIAKPSLTKLSINGWVLVIMFTIVNTAYVCFGAASILLLWVKPCAVSVIVSVVGLLMILVLPILYKKLGKWKERSYVRIREMSGSMTVVD